MPLLRRRGQAANESDTRQMQDSNEDAEDGASPSSQSQFQPEPAEYEDADGTASNHDQDESRASSQTRPDIPLAQEQSAKHHRFSVLRFRNASDSQLSLRAKQAAETPPPVPRRKIKPPTTPYVTEMGCHVSFMHNTDLFVSSAPEIITTAPTDDFSGPRKKANRMSSAVRLRRSHDIPRDEPAIGRALGFKKSRKSFADLRAQPQASPLEEMPRIGPTRQFTASSSGTGPPSMMNRPSESSRSDASSNDRQSRGSPATTPKKSPSTNPFFKFRRSKKPPEPLFNLSHLPQQKNKPPTPRESAASLGTVPTPRPASAHSHAVSIPPTDRPDVPQRHSGTPTAGTVLAPQGASQSGQSSPTRANLIRGRSSTMSSVHRDSTDDHLMPPTIRTSSSTGRKSFGDLFGLSRRRQTSEISRQGTLTPATPGSNGSKSNSLQLARESVTLPERKEDESPAKYLVRVEEVLSRGIIAATLSKGTDPFSASVLRSYMRSFSFFGDPMDMAIRKLLMEAELPKETQQIDRCLQAFANRYHECNPGIYASPDQAYFIAFSLLILHTDVFNKNNKYKMQKVDYLKNTRGEGVYDEVLECFYDNISYTPFIHVEDDIDFTERQSIKSKRKQILSTTQNDPAKRAAKEPIDPYTLILDGNLDILRPNLKDAMHLEEHYNYLGTANSLNLKDLQKTFFRTGVLQIVSARSRPDAFLSDKTMTNPSEAPQGIVDIKVTKVGLLWRKDTKKRKTRSPWQEWGAILTGAQLYFFRNTSWVKNLMHQYEQHIKQGNDGIPVIFKPPLEEFKPDGLMSTQGAVALVDKEYRKHKHAFMYVRQGGLEEVLLADDEDELNDWLAKLNYAAAFRTSGVRMRGVNGAHYDGQGRRGMRRLESSDATQLIDTPTGQVSVARSRIDHKMAQDIQAARREYMEQKIQEADEKLKVAQKQLEEHLQNGRHLQILAPIQPRSRDQLLSAAAKMSAQLKWTRMEIWRETCHRDILKQDLDEDVPILSPVSTPVKSPQSNVSHESVTSPIPRMSLSRVDSKAKTPKRHSRVLPELDLTKDADGDGDVASDLQSPDDDVFETPPQSATHMSDGLRSRSRSRSRSASRPEIGTTRRSSLSPSVSPARSEQSESGPARGKNPGPDRDHDDVDAEERHFLQQAGLLEAKSDKDVSDKATTSSVADATEQAASDKADKNKIRRSLQRTLREGAGHLSHHRSKRSRDLTPAGSIEDSLRDSTLARGTGSFTVHGKKASVINIGTELQNMSNEEKLRTRKQSIQAESPLSPTISCGDDADFQLAPVLKEESDGEQGDQRERRESAASASTATARSFRELHRKYSSAQAARSVSSGGKLAIPSDGESEVAVSFTDGRRSPLPPIDTEDEEPESPGGNNTLHSDRPWTGQKPGPEIAQEDDTEDKEGVDSHPDQESMVSAQVHAVRA